MAAVLVGCSSDPQKATHALMTKGDAHVAQKQYAEATIEYRRALQHDPQFAEGYYKLAEAYAADGNPKEALLAYVHAADLDPNDTKANLKAGNLLLVARRFEDAKSRARAVLRREPENMRGLILLGNALGGLQDLDDAVLVVEKAAELVPDRSGLHGNLAVLELARGNIGSAEAAFKKAVDLAPTSVAPLRALATFYQTVGRFAEAEAALKQAIAIVPTDRHAQQTLATLYLETGRAWEAEPFLQSVAELEQTPGAWLALADFYLAAKKIPEALTLLEKVSQAAEGFAPANIRKAVVAYSGGRKSEAHGLLREVLQKEPKNFSALGMEARLLLADGRFDEAENLVQEAIKLNPRSASLLVTLGRVRLALNQQEDALTAFSEALIYEPKRVDAQIALARIHLSRRDIDASLRFAEKGVQTNPADLEARLTLARSLLVRSDDASRAQAEIKMLLARYPSAASVHSLSGIAQLDNNDAAAARKSFDRALQLNPDHIEALSGLATLDAMANRLSDTRARVEARLAASSQPNVDLLLLAAKVYAASYDSANTENVLRRAIDADPARVEGYSLLGYFYLTTNRLGQARTEFSRVAERDPRSVGAATMVGILAEAQGDKDGARKAFEAAVEIDPSAAAAASNNLAWRYANGEGSLDVALQLAQRARSTLPNSMVIADTLGFVYYKKGLLESALWLIEEAVDREPNNPAFHYHLGLVHAAKGADAKARVALERALQLNAKFEGAEDARRVLTTLVY